jgi:ubiquinone biosynthesis protein
MTEDVFQIDPQELAAVVPDCYAEFRPLVAEGLTFFLRHLSPARLTQVFQAQAELPADADLPRRLVLFLHACPTLHKLGQVVARNRHLDQELRRHLQELESLEPHTPMEQLRPILLGELAPAEQEYHIRVADSALAEGSVAVVVPLTWSDPAAGAKAPPQHGVAKLLKPGIAEQLNEDLDILGRLADYLDQRWEVHHLPPLNYREVLDEVAELLLREIDLRQEQRHLLLTQRQFARQSDIQVPWLLPFSTEKLTVMDRVYGHKITDVQAAPAWRRPALFHSLVRALLSSILFSRDESALFHGDPHAGNLMATSDGRLAILDWSLAGQLKTEDRVQLAQVLVGGWARDPARTAGAVLALARNGADEGLVRRHVAETLEDVRWYKPLGPLWVIELLDTLVRAGVGFPPHLLLFRKAFLSLQDVLSDVCSYCSLEATLMAEGLLQFVWEWPLRWCKPLDDRDYATHVSSADLMHLAVSVGALRDPRLGY